MKSWLQQTFIYRIYTSILKNYRTKQLEKLKTYFKEESQELLKNFTSALDNAGVVYWLEFGTLLGYYREGDFISHDYDIDIGTYYENSTMVKETLLQNGFKLVREYHVIDDGGLEQCFKYKHITVDVFYFRLDGNKLYCNSFLPIANMTRWYNLYIRKPFLVKRIEVPNIGYQKVQFKDCSVYVPNDCDLYLQTHYGVNYMTPNPNYDGKKDSTNIIYYQYDDKPGYGILKEPYI